MKKIISLFQRNYDGDRLVRNEIVPGAEWVVNGEGVATRKFDGTCCMIRNGNLYKRYDVKKGKTHPDGFEPAQEPDAVTGHWPGWLPVNNNTEDRWHIEAAKATMNFHVAGGNYYDGTYELCGPKINGNPEHFENHVLIRHGVEILPDVPRDYEGLKKYLDGSIEGIVWHHPDGRMVKIKAKDFGTKRK